MRRSWYLKSEGKGTHSEQRALQGKALGTVAVGQEQEPRPARVAGAECRGQWPETWLPKGTGAGHSGIAGWTSGCRTKLQGRGQLEKQGPGKVSLQMMDVHSTAEESFPWKDSRNNP